MSFVGTADIGAQTRIVTLTVLFTAKTWAVFHVVMGRGPAFLRGALGDACANYLTRVPRFLANPALWRNLDFLEIRPHGLVPNVVDGLLFLVAIPLA